MGRSGVKPRKGKKPQHLPKVGTKTEERYEQKHEREAVLSNMGVRKTSPLMWVVIGLILLVVVVGMVAWIFAT